MSRSTTINLGRAPDGSACVLGDDERNAIQSAYGKNNTFSKEMWQEILYVTSQLTIWEPVAQNSASFNKTLSRLHKLAKLAKSLRDDIAPRRAPVGEFTPKEIWYGFFGVQKRPPEADDFFVFLLEILDPLIAMDDFAKKHEKDDGHSVALPKGPYKGFNWELWICDLWQLFERHGVPVAARKDSDKQYEGRQSPFVLFVSEFQKYLPEQCRRFQNTYELDALAQAIHRARASYKSHAENEATRAFAAADKLIEHTEQAERAELSRLADARAWRLRDTRALLDEFLNPALSGAQRTEAEEKMELCLASNEVVGLALQLPFCF
jgi:hypothetical protein